MAYEIRKIRYYYSLSNLAAKLKAGEIDHVKFWLEVTLIADLRVGSYTQRNAFERALKQVMIDFSIVTVCKD